MGCVLLAGLPMRSLTVRVANFLPSGTSWTRLLEQGVPASGAVERIARGAGRKGLIGPTTQTAIEIAGHNQGDKVMRIFLQQSMWALGLFICVAGAEAAEPTHKEQKHNHGHDCEGSTSAANAAWVAFKILFPDGIIDRSVLWGISGESPCWSDAVAFLTGARLQYGNLGFFRDKRYSHAIVLYREDTKVAVLATWKEGSNNIPGEPVMLPGKVTWQPKVTMKDVEALKAVVKKAGGNPTPYQVDLMRYQQWAHINDILEHPLEESYLAKVIENFKWQDWIDPAKTLAQPHVRTDTRLKNYPYRARPVVVPAL